MKKIDFTEGKKDVLLNADEVTEKTSKLLKWMERAEAPLFQGKDEVPKIKIYQVGRIFKLAELLIELIVLIWPYLKQIIKLFKKQS